MPTIDPVRLKLEADVASYERNLTHAQRLTEEKLARIDRAGYNTGVAIRKGFSIAKTAAVAFAASLTADMFVGAIKDGLEYASSLGEVSQQLGVTTSDLQLFRFAATQVGIEQSEMDMGLQRLTRSIGEAASGSKQAQATFDRLGVSIRDSNGQVRSAGEILPDLADGFVSLGNAQEQSAAAQDLFGKSGYKMLTLLQGGSKGVNDLASAYHRLGIELTPEQIKNADDAADKLSAVKQVLEARLGGVVADNTDTILALVDALARLADKALKVVGAWLSMKRALNDKDAAIGRANAYLDGRHDLTEAQRAGAKVRAREIIEERSGFRTRADIGGAGLLKIKERTNARFADTGFSLSTPFEKSIAGAPGQGAGIAALLGVDPVPVVVAATELANGLSRLDADIAAARADLSGDLRAKAEARKQQIDAELGETFSRIDDEEGISAATKAARKAKETELASLEKQAVEAGLNEDLARDIRDAAEKERDARETNVRLAIDALGAEADIADTRDQRLAIERRILELRQRAERDELEERIARGEVLDAIKARADLARKQSAEGTRLNRDFEGPLARYARDAKDANSRVEEAAARRIQDLNDTIADTMAKRLGVKDPFLRDLLSIFLDANIFGPLSEALSRRSGGGGLFGTLLSAVGLIGGGASGKQAGLDSLPRRAMGGPVAAGGAYLVGERGPEILKLGGTAGFVIPNHGLMKGGGGATVVQHFHLDARGAVMTQDLVNQINTMGQVAAEAGARGGHQASMDEIRRLQRPKL